jgi:hypothetical protein
MADVAAWFDRPRTNTAETGAAAWWRLIPSGVRIVTVRRPVAEVAESLARFGFDPAITIAGLRRMDAKLDQIERRVAGVLSVRFADLAREDVCARVLESCLPYPHDHAWWASLADVNVQADLPAMVRYCHEHAAALNGLADEAMVASKARKVLIH